VARQTAKPLTHQRRVSHHRIPATIARRDRRNTVHHPGMNRCSPLLKRILLCLACISLSCCAGKTPGEHFADMPHWIGGEPAGVPPRRGTAEYDAWMAARAQEAARPKTDQPK
jgi:hypothetical protein